MNQTQRKAELRETRKVNDSFKPLDSAMPEARMPLAFPFL